MRPSSHGIGNCANPSWNGTNFLQHVSVGKWAPKMEQWEYWGVVVVVLSFSFSVQEQERSGREEARMWEKEQGKQINEPNWNMEEKGKIFWTCWGELLNPYLEREGASRLGTVKMRCTMLFAQRDTKHPFMSSERSSGYCKARKPAASKTGDSGEGTLSPSSKAGLCSC